MLEPGVVFCNHCKKSFQNAYYRADNRRVGVDLMHTLKVFRKPVFKVIIADDDCEEDFVRLAEPLPDNCDGCPERLVVQFDDEEENTIVHRACPNCGHRIPLDRGKYKTALIAVAGATASGKSSWLQALAVPEHYKFLDHADYPVKFDFVSVGSGRSIDVATALGSNGNSLRFFLSEKESGQPFVEVILMDAAGEHYSMGTDEFWHNLEIADGIVYTEDICKVLSGESDVTIYNNLNENVITSRKPVAYLGTHADLLLNKPEVLMDKHTNTPLFTRDTFYPDYSPSAVLGRSRLEEHILHQLGVHLIHNAGHAFLIQSCVSDGTYNFHRAGTSMNIYDPLLYLLNQLNLMPIISK